MRPTRIEAQPVTWNAIAGDGPDCTEPEPPCRRVRRPQLIETRAGTTPASGTARTGWYREFTTEPAGRNGARPVATVESGGGAVNGRPLSSLPLTEPGVPISGTGLSRGIMLLARTTNTRERTRRFRWVCPPGFAWPRVATARSRPPPASRFPDDTFGNLDIQPVDGAVDQAVDGLRDLALDCRRKCPRLGARPPRPAASLASANASLASRNSRDRALKRRYSSTCARVSSTSCARIRTDFCRPSSER